MADAVGVLFVLVEVPTAPFTPERRSSPEVLLFEEEVLEVVWLDECVELVCDVETELDREVVDA